MSGRTGKSGRGWQTGLLHLVGRAERHIDIFENCPPLNTSAAIGGFNQIIAWDAAMFTPERINEYQGLSQLLGSDQETGAIRLPLCSPHVRLPLRVGSNFWLLTVRVSAVAPRAQDHRF